LFVMTDLGLRQLKGFATPIPAWRISGEADTEGRFDASHGVATPLVGRSEELELLKIRGVEPAEQLILAVGDFDRASAGLLKRALHGREDVPQ